MELRQGSLCYFDGLTNPEGRHGTKPLPFDGSGSANPKGTIRIVLVIRGRANSNYRASFNRIYSVGSNGGWVQGSKLNPLDISKVGHKTLFEKDAETKEEDAEKKRVKEEKKEANRVEAKRLEANKEAREGVQKAIEEANLLEKVRRAKMHPDWKGAVWKQLKDQGVAPGSAIGRRTMRRAKIASMSDEQKAEVAANKADYDRGRAGCACAPCWLRWCGHRLRLAVQYR
jgi:hypothetical protein